MTEPASDASTIYALIKPGINSDNLEQLEIAMKSASGEVLGTPVEGDKTLAAVISEKITAAFSTTSPADGFGAELGDFLVNYAGALSPVSRGGMYRPRSPGTGRGR